MIKNVFWAGICLLILLWGCGKEETPEPVEDTTQEEVTDPPNDTQNVTVLKGVFVDAAVQGLSYQTNTQSGITNANGEFSYVDGETVTFSVGDVVIGSAQGQEVLTPINLAQTNDANATIESAAVQNLAAFLQTLDVDGDHSNGITITENTAVNLGINAIDFNQPVEDILADIVVSVLQNTGLNLEIVYPAQAATQMAANLGIDYEATVNYTTTALIPTIKAFLETWENDYVFTTAQYKTNFNANGNLVALTVRSTYGNKVFFEFNFTSHNEQGLPTNGQMVIYNTSSLDGAFPGWEIIENEVTFKYNAQQQLAEMTYLFNNFYFTAYNQDNQPTQFYEDISNENRQGSITYDLTYQNGLIDTADRTYYSLITGQNNTTEFNSTRDFKYSYNTNGQLTKVNYTRVFEDTYTENGVTNTYTSTAAVEEVFSYSANQKLTEYVVNENITDYDGNSYNVATTSTYDDAEIITNTTSSSSTGYLQTTTYQNGIRTGNESQENGLLISDTTYNNDGGFVRTDYDYYENGTLYVKNKFTFSSNYQLIKYELEEYDENGELYITTIQEYENGNLVIAQHYYFEGTDTYYYLSRYEYDGNGNLTKATNESYFNGSLDFTTYDYYNSDGTISTTEGYLNDGTLYYETIWEYDTNNLLSKVTVNYADGYQIIEYYEQGELVLIEYYDPNGVLFDTWVPTSKNQAAKNNSLAPYAKITSKAKYDYDMAYEKPLNHPKAAQLSIKTPADFNITARKVQSIQSQHRIHKHLLNKK